MRNTPLPTSAATWIQRGVTAALAGLALGGVVFWGAQMLALGRSDEVRFVAEPNGAVAQAQLGQALGAQAVPAQATEQPKSALTLVAVIARGQRSGSAMISVNGQKAQAYQPGDEVQAGRYVIELGPRRVGLGLSPQGPVVEVLELKVPKLPTQG